MYLLSLRFLGAITLSVAFLYLFANLIRYTSKYFEKRVFLSQQGFPTTYLLLYANSSFSSQYKRLFREAVSTRFRIRLLTEIEETKDPAEAARVLSDAMRQVLNEVRGAPLIEKLNVGYGFGRNLVGGSFFGLLFSVLNVVLSIIVIHSRPLLIVSCALGAFYLTILLFHRVILRQNGEAFARAVISEYVGRHTTPTQNSIA
jgi:hypothetical protein